MKINSVAGIIFILFITVNGIFGQEETCTEKNYDGKSNVIPVISNGKSEAIIEAIELAQAEPYKSMKNVIIRVGSGTYIGKQIIEINRAGICLEADDLEKKHLIQRTEFGKYDSPIININANNVTVKNLELKGIIGGEKSIEDCQTGPTGIIVIRYKVTEEGDGTEQTNLTNIHIENNSIHTIGHDYQNCKDLYKKANKDYESVQAHGILIISDNAGEISDLHVTGNKLSNLKLGNSEAITIKNHVRDFSVTENTIFNVDNIAIDIVGWEDETSYQATGGKVIGNTISGLEKGNSAGDWIAGIYIDGGKNVVVAGNNVSGFGFGVEVASEKCGKTVSNVKIFNNLFHNNKVTGVGIGHSLVMEDDGKKVDNDQRSFVKDVSVFNNTIYVEKSIDGGALRFVSDRVNGLQNIVVANNIIKARNKELLIKVENSIWWEEIDKKELDCQAEGNNVDKNKRKDNPNYPEVRLINNLFHSGLTSQEFNTFLTTIRLQEKTKNTFDDPKFKKIPGDFSLHSGSPAINTGDNLFIPNPCICEKEACCDFLGKPRKVGNYVDIGAFEYQQ